MPPEDEPKPVVVIDYETRSAAELGRDAHLDAEIIMVEGRLFYDPPLKDPNKNATTVTGRIANGQPEEQRMPIDNEQLRDIRYAMQRGLAGEMGLLGMDFNDIEQRLMAAMGDAAAPVTEVRSMARPAAGMAAAAALGLALPANTFRPRPKRLPGRVVKVAPGLWMRKEKPKKYKGSAAAKKAARRGRKR